MQLRIKKGLDVPIAGKPQGEMKGPTAPFISLNLDPFSECRFKLLVQPGDTVKIGTPLVENKEIEGMVFVSPAGGTIQEIRRGEKRRLQDIVIAVAKKEEFEEFGTPLNESREALVSHLLRGGIFPHIRQRPFDVIAHPHITPRAIFIHAIESLPFVPSAERQVEGHEEVFQKGIDALAKLSSGKVHLIHHKNTRCSPFLQAKNVITHEASGPHPIGNPSVHIHFIDPITHAKDYVWTLSTHAVIAVGKMVSEGRYHFEKVLGVSEKGFFQGRSGFPVSSLIEHKKEGVRFISGDPLVGKEVNLSDFLHFFHDTFSTLHADESREAFHFFKFRRKPYSTTRAYASGHRAPPAQGYPMTTKLHGEERPFVDPIIYDKVMPMRIPTMYLVRAILAENFELAETLGLFEVTSDDFALPTFICPSKIEMMEIVKQSLSRYAKEN